MNTQSAFKLISLTLVLSSVFVLLACISPVAQESPSAGAPLNLTLVIHLEGWPLDEGEEVLERYEEIVLGYADLFKAYGAKITFETANVTTAIHQYDGHHNFLTELEARGHAIGVHADLGGRPSFTYDDFVAQLTQMREGQMELGLSARHVSGICSYLDWVTAAVEAGFEAASSGVAYCYQSMAPENVPVAYRNCPNPAACHQFVPEELIRRLSPWRAVDGTNWPQHNPNGELILFPSSGTLDCFAENRSSNDSNTACTFNPLDIATFFDELNLALELLNPNSVNTYYVVWSLGSQLNPQLLEQWLMELQDYADAGEIAWRTIPEMIDLYNAR